MGAQSSQIVNAASVVDPCEFSLYSYFLVLGLMSFVWIPLYVVSGPSGGESHDLRYGDPPSLVDLHFHAYQYLDFVPSVSAERLKFLFGGLMGKASITNMPWLCYIVTKMWPFVYWIALFLCKDISCVRSYPEIRVN